MCKDVIQNITKVAWFISHVSHIWYELNEYYCNDALINCIYIVYVYTYIHTLINNYLLITTMSWLFRRQIFKDDLKTSSTATGLNCNKPTWFWFAWSDGQIQAGIGISTGQNVIVQYKDSSPMSVRAVGVTIYETPIIYSISDSMWAADFHIMC